MGGFRVVTPRNFSDLPGHSGLMDATTATLLELGPFFMLPDPGFIITASRMISGKLLKKRKGFCILKS